MTDRPPDLPAERPEPETPGQTPPTEPWHDPGPPVRKVNLPPDSPSPGVDVPNTNIPRPDR